MNVVKNYDGGIVEISNNDVGRDKAKRCVGVLLRGVLRRRCESPYTPCPLSFMTDALQVGDVEPSANPCSPILYNAPTSWEPLSSPHANNVASSAPIMSTNTPTSATIPAPSYSATDLLQQPAPAHIPLPSPPSYRSITQLAAATALPMTPPAHTANASPNSPQARSPSAPTSPARSRSMADMMSEHQKTIQMPQQAHDGEPGLSRSKSILDLVRTSNNSGESVKSAPEIHQPASNDTEPVNPFRRDPKQE